MSKFLLKVTPTMNGTSLEDYQKQGVTDCGVTLNWEVAAVERLRGLGRWSLLREVQSSIPRRGYIPHVTAEMQWHGVTPPGCDQWQTDR